MNSIECLESRQLFAADPTFELSAKGTLVVHGSALADTIQVSLLHGKAADGFRAILENKTGSHDGRFKFKSVKRIYVDSGGGNDSIFIGGGAAQGRPATVLGGAGNDKIDYFCISPIYASGGNGNDVVGATATLPITSNRNRDVIDDRFASDNSSGACTLLGNAGNDTVSGDSNDSVDAGSGSDVAVVAMVATSNSFPQARADALAVLYFARLGVIGAEATEGTYLLVATDS